MAVTDSFTRRKDGGKSFASIATTKSVHQISAVIFLAGCRRTSESTGKQ